MKRTLALSIAAASLMSGVAFAAEKGTGSAPAVPPAPPAAPAAKTADKPKAVVLGVTTAIARPENTSASRSNYPFDTMDVDASFGVKNRDKASFNSIIYQAHKRHEIEVLGPDGKPEMIRKKTSKKGEPDAFEMVAKTVRTREFEAFDVDPAADPEGASVRIFRNK